MSTPRFILKRDRDESGKKIVPDDEINKPKEKVVTPPTKKELQELKEEYVVQCAKIPRNYKDNGVKFRLICNLCEQYLESVSGAKGHILGKKHVENKIMKKVEEELKLVGSPNEEQFYAITAKLQEVYDEWSAEACGQQTVREKIVSDFQEFVQRIKGCENVIVEVFGSTYTGFALKDSDINMNLRFSDDSSSTYDIVINGVLKHLSCITDGDDKVVYTDLKNHLYSSVSHITFTHQPSGLSCHVRYGSYHKMPIYTGKLLQRYGIVDHRVKVLAVVLKYWAKLCRLDSQELGSYPSQMFVLMLIHFLQHRTPPLLPVPPKLNDFDDTPKCLEHFDEYLSGIDYMIKTWKVTSTESLGVLWLDMLRYYSIEASLEKEVVQVTQNNLLLKENTSWSHYKQLVVLSPVNPCCNIARTSSSRKMYLYFEACFKATLIYFGKAVLNKPSISPKQGCSKQQNLLSHDPPVTSHGPCVTEGNASAITEFPKNVTHLSDVATQLSNFSSDDPVKQCKENEPIRSQHEHDLDYDNIPIISKLEISCERNNTHLQDSVVVEDIEGLEASKGVQYEFSSSNFTKKELPDVCSLCKKEGHTFTSPNCPSGKKVEKIILASHPPLGLKHLKELDRVFVNLKENVCLKPMDKMLRRHICSIIEHHVKIIYPDMEMVLFGSSANEFGKAGSDVDINMKLPGDFEHDDNVQVIESVAHHLKNRPQQDCWMNTIEVVTTARVPLVKMKLTERWNSLECDISLGNSLALHNTQLLAHYAKIDERVQVMGYVLKEFAKSADMCDASSGSLSSYAYIILLLHYLQQVKPPVIPVLQQIGEGGHVDVDGWNCWFYQFDNLSQLEKIWHHIGENKKTIGELLINFFRYYLEEFDWQRHVVSIRQLEPLGKLEKEWATKRVCIEDPFNHDHNLSSHLSSKMWSYICNAFKCAHDHFTNPQLYTKPLTITTVLSVGFKKNVPKDGLCYTCGKRGHGFYNCPNGRRNNACDLCGKQGHIKSQCPLGYHPRYPVQLLPRPPITQFLPRSPYSMSNMYPVPPGLPRAGINLIPTHHNMSANPMSFMGPQPHERLPMNVMSYGSQFGRPMAPQMQLSREQTGKISQPNNWPHFR